MAFALCSLSLLFGISGLLTGVWSFPLHHWKNIKCPLGWTQLDCHCYIYQSTPESFIDAEMACIALDGNLASIHNDLENKIVLQLLADNSVSAGWIGLHDAILENDFIWTDGSLEDFTNFDAGPPQEPNETGPCVEIDSSTGLWGDEDCTDTKEYVCIRNVCKGGDPSFPDCPAP
ncbi:lithostathine-1-beta-like [Festucalex cinctus]